jgi:DNA-binding NtrC family response regulator
MKKKLKIVFIEDSDYDIDLVYHQLNKSKIKYISEHVKTGEALEHVLAKCKPDIILSDYALPSFDGLSAFHIKQKIYPDIPFIIVSGTIGEENAVELIKNGVTDYVLKDKLFTLPHKIDRALEDAEKERQKRIADKRLKMQYDKLYEIANLQSHQVRGPISTILGLTNLINYDNPHDNTNIEVIRHLRDATKAFDRIIHMIVQKTNEIKAI